MRRGEGGEEGRGERGEDRGEEIYLKKIIKVCIHQPAGGCKEGIQCWV